MNIVAASVRGWLYTLISECMQAVNVQCHSPVRCTMPRQAPISTTHPASQHVVTNGRAVERQLSVLGSHRLRDKRQPPSRPMQLEFPRTFKFSARFQFETRSRHQHRGGMARGWRLCGGVALSIVLAIAPHVSCICEPGPGRRDWSSVKVQAPHAFVHPGTSVCHRMLSLHSSQQLHPCSLHADSSLQSARMVHAGVQRMRFDDALHDRYAVRAWS
jgi:hypothetical protein